MIIVRLMGGLGNQMFQYAAGRAMSLSVGRRLLFDARFYAGRADRVYKLGVFNCPVSKLEDRGRWWVRAWMSGPARPVRGVARRLVPSLGVSYIQDDGSAFDGSAGRAAGILYLDGYWQSERYFADHREVVRQDFEFRDPPDARNESILDRIRNTSSVCVHVRRGDYVRSLECRSIYACLGSEYYGKAIAYLRERVPDLRIFVFSDDPAEAIRVVDTDLPITVVEHNQAANDHEDLRLMSHCKHFVIANSSFSWWGAWLSGHTRKIVVAPRAWFVDGNHSDKDMVPDSWIRL